MGLTQPRNRVPRCGSCARGDRQTADRWLDGRAAGQKTQQGTGKTASGQLPDTSLAESTRRQHEKTARQHENTAQQRKPDAANRRGNSAVQVCGGS